jgi:hypothetical protein
METTLYASLVVDSRVAAITKRMRRSIEKIMDRTMPTIAELKQPIVTRMPTKRKEL